MRLVVVILMILIQSACQSSRNSQASAIIGTNDLIEVNANRSNVEEKFHKIIEATGIFFLGCTVTHVGNNLAVTAAHCFSYLDDEIVRNGLQEGADCSHRSIWWHYRRDAPRVSTKCKKILRFIHTDSQDFALFSVEKAPEAKVELELGDYSSGEVTLFSHPSNKYLHWSKDCFMSISDEPTLSESQFTHDCDTQTGSSGGAIIDLDSLKIVGIHSGSIENEINYGTYIKSINLEDFYF